MTFKVACKNKDDIFDYIVETSAAFGAECVITDKKPNLSYRIPVEILTPYIGKTVCLSSKAGISLSEFEHPEDATYIIGSDNTKNDLNCDNALYVKIDTPVNYPLRNYIALALCLHDRHNKAAIK